MSEPSEGSRRGMEGRRSRREPLGVRVIVQGQSAENIPFQEETYTFAMSTYGALIGLATSVKPGQLLVLQNCATGEERECRVVRLGSEQGGKTEVGVEFIRPAR